MNFNIRNNFVEDKGGRSNKVNFMNSNVPTYSRFDKLRAVENTQNDAKFDDAIETDVSKARQIPFVKSSESAVKKRPVVVINKYPESQHIFGKENINVKRRHEAYTDAAHGNIKKDTRKTIMFTDSIPRGIWICKFNQYTDGEARLKSFPGAKSKELAHYVAPTIVAHQCKDHGVKEIILSSVLATGRVNADVLIHFNESLKNLCTTKNFINGINN